MPAYQLPLGSVMSRKMSWWLVAFSALTMAVILAFPASAEKFYPRDETSSAPGFRAFLSKFTQAVQRRDANFVLRRIAPSSNFGGDIDGFGLDGFVARFNLLDQDDRFWRIVERLVRLPGAYDTDTGTVVYPWLFLRFPQFGRSFRGDAVILGDGVNLRDVPSTSGRILNRLSWDRVSVVEPSEEWTRIHCGGQDQIGWVKNEFLYTPDSHRIGFGKERGEWKILYFLDSRS